MQKESVEGVAVAAGTAAASAGKKPMDERALPSFELTLAPTSEWDAARSTVAASALEFEQESVPGQQPSARL